MHVGACFCYLLLGNEQLQCLMASSSSFCGAGLGQGRAGRVHLCSTWLGPEDPPPGWLFLPTSGGLALLLAAPSVCDTLTLVSPRSPDYSQHGDLLLNAEC